MQKLLLTGASGFIGRRLAPLLVRQYGKENVRCLSYSKGSAHERRGEEALQAEGISYEPIDLLTPATLTSLRNKYTTIVHLAASTDTSTNDFSSNDVGTKNLLAALGPLDESVHFIYFSSAAVYAGRSDVSRPIDASTTARPSNEYGRSKLRAEIFLREEAERQGFRLTIIRTNTVYGPDPRANSILDVLKGQILGHSFVTRLNWPGQIGIVHVDDVCKKVLELTAVPRAEWRAQYLIFSTESLTLAQMYAGISAGLGMTYRPLHLPTGVWKASYPLLKHSPLLEAVLPSALYNVLWRANLVVRGVLASQTPDAEVAPSAPKTFSESISAIVAL